MAKTVKFKPKAGKGLDTVIGDMLVHSIKKMVFGDDKKKSNKRDEKVSAAQRNEVTPKPKSNSSHSSPNQTEKYPSKLERIYIAAHEPANIKIRQDKLKELMDKAAKYDKLQKGGKQPKAASSEPTIEYGPDVEINYPEEKPAPVQKPARPYFPMNDEPKRNSFGVYTHPRYKTGDMFNHSAEPHVGPVKYIATLNPKGHPLVQAVNDQGHDIEKFTFQADPKNLTEYQSK